MDIFTIVNQEMHTHYIVQRFKKKKNQVQLEKVKKLIYIDLTFKRRKKASITEVRETKSQQMIENFYPLERLFLTG